MKAFVICGGKGTRLRPLTLKTPKPLLPIQGKPILLHIMERLRAEGISEFVLFTGYLKEQIRAYFGDGRKFGLKISYFEEEEERGTAGAILHAKSLPEETFLVTMGDHLSSYPLKEMLASHKKSRCIATIGTLQHNTKINYGVIRTGPDGEVREFQEKPVLSHTINTGIYLLEPEIFKFINEGEDFAKNVFPRLLSKGKRINTFPVHEWNDIGNLDDYARMGGKA
ncbi:MAG TPA: nucleotidyltransferase family protein [Candidatus Bilamarchaeaceae archaeon]|nr:nucleotidyltransferase family protein [Candidatus Bilamarchaeaceae archaeon]